MNIYYTTGYAGTGKSTKLLELLGKLKPSSSVVICPTHKAIKRLLDSGEVNIECKTIHSLLGWIPTINEDAQHISHIDSTAKLNKPLDFYTDIVIDEAGMMSEDMLTEITSRLEELHNFETDSVTLHLFLDPYQLLPVKGRQIQLDPDTTTNLTVQYRAESKDIVDCYTKFVHYLEGKNKDDLSTPHSENIKPFNLAKFKQGDRLLAYTNEAVGEWNKKIAMELNIDGYEGQDVQLGSKLDLVRCLEFVDNVSPYCLKNAFENGDLILQNSQINKKWLDKAMSDLYYNPYIRFIMDDNKKMYPVIVGIGKANIVLREAKEEALKDRSKFSDVYTLGRAFIMDYSFATTVHKSQGSEFDTVFIDKEDVQKSIFKNNFLNYARLMYVAISRTKKTLYI